MPELSSYPVTDTDRIDHLEKYFVTCATVSRLRFTYCPWLGGTTLRSGIDDSIKSPPAPKKKRNPMLPICAVLGMVLGSLLTSVFMTVFK